MRPFQKSPAIESVVCLVRMPVRMVLMLVFATGSAGWALCLALSAPNLPAQTEQHGGRLSGPPHPVIEAPDAEWEQWHAQYADWFKGQSYKTQHELLVPRSPTAGNPVSDVGWRLDARRRGLSLRQIQALAADGVVATGRPLNLRGKPTMPMEGVFVTSDMVLHAYNMMVADFVRGMEMQRAPRFRRSLEAMWQEIGLWARKHNVSRKQSAAPVEHARRVIGTALLCLGSSVQFDDKSVEQDCRTELQLILDAAEVRHPGWLGPPDGDFIGIDYQRMKPVGFYAENETLIRLFRAVRWLQIVPFRPEQDTELAAFAILAEVAEACGIGADDLMQRQWLGLPNNLTLAGQGWLGPKVAAALVSARGEQKLEAIRTELAGRGAPLHANDNLRLDPKLAGKAALPPLLKFTPAYLTADSLLLSEIILTDRDRLPEGRMITAYLGDEAAVEELRRAGWSEEVIGVVRRAAVRRSAAALLAGEVVNPYDDRSTFNSLLLDALAALFLPPEKAAPAFLKSAGWRAKSRNTTLAAWAEKRHTWVLHEVEPMAYGAGGGPPPPPPGLIEPNPEFFRRLASLAEQAFGWMEQNGFLRAESLTSQSRREAGERLLVARLIHELKLDASDEAKRKVTIEDLIDEISPRYGIAPDCLPKDAEWQRMTAADVAGLRETLLLSAEALIGGLDVGSSPEEITNPPVYRRERWTTFIGCLRRLEKMAEKQLRGEEWDDAEREYLTFGVWMDYHSVCQLADNGMTTDPKANGPKIAPVVSNPRSGEVLHVGTGEMAELYVLYPWKGSSFLYRGPVVPYYELASKTRLNDEEWRALLKSATPPRQPEWLDQLHGR